MASVKSEFARVPHTRKETKPTHLVCIIDPRFPFGSLQEKPTNNPLDLSLLCAAFFKSIQSTGLGASPLDVVFNGSMGVFCPEGDYDMTGGALDTFWRSAENFRMSTSFEWMGNAGMLWAVSQAAPLRRVVVDGDLSLYEYEPPFGGAGYSSGGFLASTIYHINLKRMQFLLLLFEGA